MPLRRVAGVDLRTQYPRSRKRLNTVKRARKRKKSAPQKARKPLSLPKSVLKGFTP
jgi:hypothetical protein